MDAVPLFSVVIPTTGRADALLRAIASVRAQDYPCFEMVIVDDASAPPLPPLPPDITIVRFASRVGACKGRNEGSRRAKGQYYLYLDDDAELICRDSLRRVEAWFQLNPDLGAVGFRQLTPEGKVHYMQPAPSERPCYTGQFFSYGCALRASVLDHVGGFNEEFGYYYEEIELSLRVHAQGYRIVYDPYLEVIHHQDERFRDWKKIHRQNTRNALISAFLHYPSWLVPAAAIAQPRQLARQTARKILPAWDDLRWLAKELWDRRGYLARHRQPFPYLTIARWRQLRLNPRPIVPVPARASPQ